MIRKSRYEHSPSEVMMHKSGFRRGRYLVASVFAGVLGVFVAYCVPAILAQRGPASQGKTDAAVEERYPTLYDITATTKIQFEHVSSSEQKYIVESMSGESH
jgi:hypothetical protein